MTLFPYTTLFRSDATGSDKNTAFSLPHDPRSDLVLVFEAPIDLMSYLTLHRDTTNAVAVEKPHCGKDWNEYLQKRLCSRERGR